MNDYTYFVNLLKDTINNINVDVKRCKRCVMDESVKDIIFDENGVCNYCKDFNQLLANPPKKKLELKLNDLIELIKKDGKAKEFDCVVGVSGGVDSSYTLAKVVQLGLRPLPVHMDNGWNSELATNNIKRLVNKLNLELYTYVIDWNEYRQLMQAFFDADVVDIELLYDNALRAVTYKIADKFNIKYILAGSNIITEGFKMPENWSWFKFDKKNIKALAKRNRVKIKTFPAVGTLDFIYYEYLKRIKWISFLDYLPDYNKNEALKFLQENMQFKPYPYKHYESIFTRFYQAFILPIKFKVDKRKVHFSNLILTKQLDRKEALQKLKEIPYDTEQDLIEDIKYFLKKMNWSVQDLKDYLNRGVKLHNFYPTEKPLWDFLVGIYKKYSLSGVLNKVKK